MDRLPLETVHDVAVQFHRLMRRLGAQTSDCVIWQKLKKDWSAAHRVYHGFAHLAVCVHAWQRHQADWHDQDSTLLALFYHDVIYFPYWGDNEGRSIARLRHDAKKLGLAQPTVERAAALIELTRHLQSIKDDTPESQDAQLFLDIDLSILGAPQAVYHQYSEHVQQEYRWLPNFYYRQGRRKVLKHFLARPKIFQSRFFAPNESQARQNLQHEINVILG